MEGRGLQKMFYNISILKLSIYHTIKIYIFSLDIFFQRLNLQEKSVKLVNFMEYKWIGEI